MAPLLGAQAHVDAKRGRWLHIHVRPHARGLTKVLKVRLAGHASGSALHAGAALQQQSPQPGASAGRRGCRPAPCSGAAAHGWALGSVFHRRCGSPAGCIRAAGSCGLAAQQHSRCLGPSSGVCVIVCKRAPWLWLRQRQTAQLPSVRSKGILQGQRHPVHLAKLWQFRDDGVVLIHAITGSKQAGMYVHFLLGRQLACVIAFEAGICLPGDGLLPWLIFGEAQAAMSVLHAALGSARANAKLWPPQVTAQHMYVHQPPARRWA